MRHVHIFCSDIADQSAKYAVACVTRALELEDGGSFKHHCYFSDLGPHFHCARFVAFALVTNLVSRAALGGTASVDFAPGGHGKWLYDSLFGWMPGAQRVGGFVVPRSFFVFYS